MNKKTNQSSETASAETKNAAEKFAKTAKAAERKETLRSRALKINLL